MTEKRFIVSNGNVSVYLSQWLRLSLSGRGQSPASLVTVAANQVGTQLIGQPDVYRWSQL